MSRSLASNSARMRPFSPFRGVLRVLLFASLPLIGIDGSRAQSPEIDVQQNSVSIASGGTKDFGSVATGGNASLDLVVKNTGSGPLTVTGITLAPKTDFSITSTTGFQTTTIPAGTSWTARDTKQDWAAVASSADGSKLAAAIASDEIVVSTDGGMTWNTGQSSTPSRSWRAIASSADGSKLVAAAYNSQIYTSTDSGINWTARDSSRSWTDVASSSDGSKLVAVVSFGKIYTSTDSGVNWTARESSRQWQSVASSTDGTKLAATVYGGQIYTSTDSGSTWAARESNRSWEDVASSADGSRLVAVVNNGQIHTSADSGVNWTARESARTWLRVTSSADGAKLAAIADKKIHTSTDFGATWTARETVRDWKDIASSADGNRLVATVEDDKIYTSVGSEANSLNAGGAATLSVKFTPASSGSKSATLSIGSNDADENTYTVNLTGTGTAPGAPEIDVQQAGSSIANNGAKAFSSVTVGSSSSLDFIVKNTGTGPLNVASIEVRSAVDFSVTSGAISSIAAGASATVKVRFAPTAAGTVGTTFTIKSNDADEGFYNLSLTGMGAAPSGASEIDIQQAGASIAGGGSKDFGSITAGTDKTLDFTIRNTGTAGLTLTGTRITPAGDFSIAAMTGHQTTTIPVGSSLTARDSARSWSAIAGSMDGVKLLATDGGAYTAGDLYASSDSGATWTKLTAAGSRKWSSLASSSDGSKLVAAVAGGKIYTSADSGATWTARESDRGWASVASSANGTKLVAAVQSGQLHTSTDSGASWTARDSQRGWQRVASSSDGTRLAAMTGTKIYTSVDSGATWIERPAVADGAGTWLDLASSADGMKLAASAYYGRIHTSTDGGATWTRRAAGGIISALAISTDGGTLVGVEGGGHIFVSHDAGAAWVRTAADASRTWTDVALSSDGKRLAATVSGGKIHTSVGASAPTVAGGASATLSVKFAPASTGSKSATLSIGSNDADENPYVINLTGMGSGSGSGPLSFAPAFDLSSLNGTKGFRINGAAANDQAGWSVGGSRDLNGDGIDDLLLGSPVAGVGAGAATVLFGKTTAFAATVGLGSLGGGGTIVTGPGANDGLGIAVRAAGDINGDQVNDFIVGASDATQNDLFFSGAAYVVFGRSGGFASAPDLAMLNGSDGFRLDGLAGGDRTGISVDGIGDLNGDGVDDLAVGAPEAGPDMKFGAGKVYVVFGRKSAFGPTVDLGALDGSNGFVIPGLAESDNLGSAVAGVGDLNGDGRDDLAVGANRRAAFDNFEAGTAYVVFGRNGGVSALLDLAALDGSNGFRLEGEGASHVLGGSLDGAGDVNGDGIDDLIVGAPGAAPDQNDNAGSAYVVFGRSGAFGASIDLPALDGMTGFRIDGEFGFDNLGQSVGAAGDIKRDGIDDVIVGAPFSSSTGRAYVVFGAKQGLPATLNVSLLDGANGFQLNGVDADEAAGIFVGGGFDLNKDGAHDLVIGANNANSSTGRAYVVFGGPVNALPPAPELRVSGKGMDIANGDAAPDAADGTLFGMVDFRRHMETHSFVVRNTGKADLNLTGINVNGAHAADFMAHGLTLPATVAPGGMTTFKVTFDPSAEGARNATISLASNDGNANPHEFGVAGTGLNVIHILQTRKAGAIKPPFNAMGQFQLDLQGATGVSYRVDYAESLSGPWMTLATITGDGSQKQVTDLTSISKTKRFYRVIVINN